MKKTTKINHDSETVTGAFGMSDSDLDASIREYFGGEIKTLTHAIGAGLAKSKNRDYVMDCAITGDHIFQNPGKALTTVFEAEKLTKRLHWLHDWDKQNPCKSRTIEGLAKMHKQDPVDTFVFIWGIGRFLKRTAGPSDVLGRMLAMSGMG